MSHFGSMFPDISRSYIETVLRQHNGDVSSTIDDLLRFQQSSNGVASGSSFETSIKEPIDFDQCDGKKTENRKVVDVSEEAPSVSHQIQRTKPPEK